MARSRGSSRSGRYRRSTPSIVVVNRPGSVNAYSRWKTVPDFHCIDHNIPRPDDGNPSKWKCKSKKVDHGIYNYNWFERQHSSSSSGSPIGLIIGIIICLIICLGLIGACVFGGWCAHTELWILLAILWS